MHAQIFSGIRCLAFNVNHNLLSYFVCASSDGSSDTVPSIGQETQNKMSVKVCIFSCPSVLT